MISIKLLYNLAIVCLKWAFSYVDFMDIIIGDIPTGEEGWVGGGFFELLIDRVDHVTSLLRE